MKKVSLISIAMLAILALTVVPTYAFVIAPNPSGENGKYEMFGPHVAGINIIIYSTDVAECTAMAGGTLDLEDWALSLQYANLWGGAQGPITEANFGGEAGYFLLDINNNATMTPDDLTAGVHNPTSELPLRQAIASLCNRSDIVSFTGGMALPIYTVIPAYMAGYVHPDINPTGSLAALTYGGFTGNPAAANAILDANGYTIDGSGWRIDPVTQGGNGAELNLIFYSRSGDRGTFGDTLNAALTAAHIKTNYISHVPRSTVTGPVFAQEYFNLYTGGWTGIGPDPDFFCDLYNGSNYYHPGSPPNYLGADYADLNANLTTIKLAPDQATATAATYDAQVKFAQHAVAVPLWSYSGTKAYKNVPVASSATGNWTGLVNQKGIGVNSWWSTLSMRTQGAEYPGIYAQYGFSSTVSQLNMVYVQWFWDQEVVGRIYDGGAGRDPMTLASWIPQLYKNWTIGTWIDKSAGGEVKTAVKITLRPDVYWQDGQPFTSADIYYTLVEMSKDLLAKGFPPPWWYPTVQYMRSVEVLDPYNVEILLDVYSVWAVGWVIGNVVMPMHIWKPIVDASISPSNNPIVQGNQPDANVIGTGPFRWFSGSGTAPGTTIVLVANTPGSVVHSITSPGYYLYCPIYVDVNPDKGMSNIDISPTGTSVVSNVTVTIRNLYQGGHLSGTKYVYLNETLQGVPVHKDLAPITPWNVTYPYPTDQAGAADVELFQFTLPKTSISYVKVAFHIEDPPLLENGEANPWISQWINVTIPIYVTIKEDIAGSNLFDDMVAKLPGYGLGPPTAAAKKLVPTPDRKVDMKDVGGAAQAFGTTPGHIRWNSVADINLDFTVDMKDIGAIARQFGYH